MGTNQPHKVSKIGSQSSAMDSKNTNASKATDNKSEYTAPSKMGNQNSTDPSKNAASSNKTRPTTDKSSNTGSKDTNSQGTGFQSTAYEKKDENDSKDGASKSMAAGAGKKDDFDSKTTGPWKKRRF